MSADLGLFDCLMQDTLYGSNLMSEDDFAGSDESPISDLLPTLMPDAAAALQSHHQNQVKMNCVHGSAALRSIYTVQHLL
jgi:hypothetical protein